MKLMLLISLWMFYGCGKDGRKHLAYETEMVCELRLDHKSCIGQGITCRTDYINRQTKCTVRYTVEED